MQNQNRWGRISSRIEKNAHFFFFVIGLICAAPLVFLTPPFQVPDEQQHFFRAYQISEGSLFAVVHEGVAGATLPSSLIEMTNRYLGSRLLHPDRSVKKVSATAIEQDLHEALRSDDREFIGFSGAAFYSPIPYMPQAVAMLVARKLGFGPLELMYSARIANLCLALLLISVAVSLTPFNKPGFMLIALLPMSLYLFSSVSADSLVIGAAFLFLALSLKAFVKKQWDGPSYVAGIFCAVVFCSVKIVYAPLILASLPAFLQRKEMKKAVLLQSLLFVIPVLVTYTWLNSVSDLIIPVKTNTSPIGQLHHVQHHPWLFAKAVLHGFVSNDFYFFMTIGVLGWLSVKLYVIAYVLPVLSLLVVLFCQSKINIKAQIPVLAWWFSLYGTSILLVCLALYLYWTPVGAYAVEGVQGRYFLPLFPLLLVATGMAISRSRFHITSTNALILVGALGLIEAGLTFARLTTAYWL